MSLPLEPLVSHPRWGVRVCHDDCDWYLPLTSPIAEHDLLGDQHLSPGSMFPSDVTGFGVWAVS